MVVTATAATDAMAETARSEPSDREDTVDRNVMQRPKPAPIRASTLPEPASLANMDEMRAVRGCEQSGIGKGSRRMYVANEQRVSASFGEIESADRLARWAPSSPLAGRGLG